MIDECREPQEVFDKSENFAVCIFWDVLFHLCLGWKAETLNRKTHPDKPRNRKAKDTSQNPQPWKVSMGAEALEDKFQMPSEL